MSRKKIIELIEEQNLPRALIIGGSLIAPYLSDELTKNGCQVTVSDSYYPALGKFSYIFQFGNFSSAGQADKYLLINGKFLFIETEKDENLSKNEKVKILRVGNLSFWSEEELVRVILKTIFSSKEKIFIDLCRGKQYKLPQVRKIDKQAISFKDRKNLLNKTSISKITISKETRIFNRKIFLVSLLLGAIFIFSLTIFYSILSFQKDLNTLRFDITSNNWQAVPSDIKKVKGKVLFSQNIYEIFLKFFPLRNISYVEDLETILSTSERLLTTGEDILTFSKELQKGSVGISVAGSITKEDLFTLKDKILNLQEVLTRAKTKIEKVELPFFPKQDYISILSSFSQKFANVSDFLPVVEEVFLQPEPKIYLLLFQNNMELRPTGGFIGSFGLLTIEKGKIIDLKIEDVYTADGQLKGHVDPPLPIRKYLNQPHFFLRDSNFDPDFTISAAKAAFFLQKELGREVDGVVGINLFVLQKILQILGPIKIADFGNDSISADNFFFKAQYYASDKFFPGSTAKKDFLTSVTSILMQKLESDNSLSFVELLPVIRQLLDEKNIILFVNNGRSQKVIEEKGWAGRMVDVKCVGEIQLDFCFPDYLSIVEANLGVNKANYFISKAVAIEKIIDQDGNLGTTLTISYENSANSQIFNNTFYTNYLQIFVPVGSILTGITLNNAPISSSDIDIENYGLDKMSFGFLVRIAPENKGVIKVTYTLPRLVTSEVSSYQFFYQKQGGDKLAPLILTIKYLESLTLKPANFKSTSERDNEVYYTTDTSVDRIFAIEVNR